MVKTKQDIIGEECTRNDDVLAVSDEDKKIAWKSYHKNLLKTEFAWNSNILSQADTVRYSWWCTLLNRQRQGLRVNKMKNGKAAAPYGVVSEMVKTAGEAGVDMITDPLYQIIVGGVPAEWELCTIVNHLRENGIL